MTAEAKTALWTKADKLATSWEGKFGDAAAAAFEHDRREILALLREAKRKSLERKATVDWQDYLLSVTDYLRMGGDADENWRKQFAPVMRGLISARGEQLNEDFGMSFDVENVYATEWFKTHTMTFASPINDVTLRDISNIIAQAQSDGSGLPAVQKQLGQLFEQYMNGSTTPEDWQWYEERMPAYRRELIARDQIQRSANGGSLQIFKGYGSKRKEWISTRDFRVRDAHAAADGQIVEIDKPFNVGGYSMMFPGDNSMGAPIALFIQDRCSILPAGFENE